MSASAAPRAQLALYRQQLAAVEAMGNNPQTQALRENLLEVITMLCEDLGEKPPQRQGETKKEPAKKEEPKKDTAIWEDLSKPREQEDAVSRSNICLRTPTLPPHVQPKANILISLLTV
eukprot:3335987-Rhodomonas_salina.1